MISVVVQLDQSLVLDCGKTHLYSNAAVDSRCTNMNITIAINFVVKKKNHIGS